MSPHHARDPHHDSRSEPFENPRTYRRPSDPCIRPQPPSHSKTGRPCSKRKDPECALPFCKAHRDKGDGAFRKVPHPLAGLCLVANFDIPKGYKTVFWGTRKRWRDTENKEGGDYAMSFRTNGGVIDPTTHKEGSQLQFMSCPGPNEKMNMRSTDRFFGATHEKDPSDRTGKRGGLVGREFVVMDDVPKNHQLLIWYGSQWFNARGIPRIDVGLPRYPATLKRTSSAETLVNPLADTTNKKTKA